MAGNTTGKAVVPACGQAKMVEIGENGEIIGETLPKDLADLNNELKAAKEAIANITDEMALDATQAALAVTGTFEPTPFSDLSNAGISIARGNYWEAGLDLVGVIPYLGDAIGKGGKAAIMLKRAEKLASSFKKAEAAVKAAKKKIDDAIDAINKKIKKGEKGKDGTTVCGGGGGNKKNDKKKENEKCASDPVLISTGEYVNAQSYCHVEGTIPFIFESYYNSGMGKAGPLGKNRTSILDERILVEKGEVIYQDNGNQRIHFFQPEDLGAVYNVNHPQLSLQQRENGNFQINFSHKKHHFKAFTNGNYHLILIEDLNGNYQHLIRNPQGWLEKIEHSDGYEIHFNNNEQGLRTSVDWFVKNQYKGHLASLKYNKAGHLITLDSPVGSSYEWQYDSQDRLHLWKDSLHTQARIHYDQQGRVVHIETTGAYDGDRFQYDDANRITSYFPGSTDEVTHYHYDENKNILVEENARGSIKRYEYNELDQKISEDDANGHRTEYGYDTLGNIDSITLPDGSTTTYHYNSRSWLLRVTNPAGQSWNYSYDAYGNITTVIDPADGVKHYEYDHHGNLTTLIDSRGSQEVREYDQHNRLIKVIDSMANITGIERDIFGRITTLTDPKGAKTQYDYQDQKGKPLHYPSSIQFADNTSVNLQYNSEGLLTQHTDPAGQQTQYQYTAFDLLTHITDPLGNTLIFRYDQQERLKQVTNALSEHWTFERDNTGRVTKETDFAGRVIHYEYDKAGNLTKKLHPDKHYTEYEYNARDQLTVKRHWENRQQRPEVSTYGYNAQGLLISAKNKHSLVEFERDGLGRITKEIQDGHEVCTTWDVHSGRTERLNLPSGNDNHYVYEPRGLLLAAQFGEHDKLRFQYDERGQETQRYRKDGFQLEQQWDIVGRLQQQHSPLNHPNKTENPSESLDSLLNRHYQYDKLDNPRHITDQRWGDTTYQYNANQQITEADHNGEQERYGYDAAQNIKVSHQSQQQAIGDINPANLSHWQQQAGGAVTDIQQGKTNNSNNKVKDKKSQQYQYDKKGRLTQKTQQKDGFRPQISRYQWDYDDRLIKLITPDNSHYHYTYDALGRRIEKKKLPTTSTTENKTESQTETSHSTRYIWDGNTLAEEVPLYADGTPAWEHATTWHYEPESFRPLAKQQGDNLWYIVTDAMGTPKELIHENGQQIGWAQQHSVWGKTRQQLKQPAANDDNTLTKDKQYTDCNLRFQGQYFDEESGLHYNNQRYYDPETAQYLTPDPIGLLGGTRPQGYVHNPNQWVDPLGLDVKTGAGRDYVTYRGIKGGKPYTGIASAPSSQGLRPSEIVNRRYSGNFDDFGGNAPDPIYSGSGVEGKQTARGLEQHHYEQDVAKHGKDNVANAQNPVGEKNQNKDNYKDAADKELNKKCNC